MDLSPVWITLQLAAVTTLILLLVGTPIAWWLAWSQARFRPAVEAVVALPLVLPPTVLGFYLLMLLSPQAWLGGWWLQVSGSALTFSFAGLVVGSVLYSLPFTVQPLQSAFVNVGRETLEMGATLGASPIDRFLHIVLPLSLRGYLVAAVLTFAHTVGEFGIVLMIGGNIPGKTQVLSIAIYEQVETIQYATAHVLSGGLLIFSFVVLLLVYTLNGRRGFRVS